MKLFECGLVLRLAGIFTLALFLFAAMTSVVAQEMGKTYTYTLEDAAFALRVSNAVGDTKAARRLAQIAHFMQQSSDQRKWSTFQITAPDGKRYEVNGPSQLTRDDVIAVIKTRQKQEETARLEQKLANLRAQNVEPQQATLTEKGRSMLSGILGPSSPAECFSNYGGKVRIPDAIELLKSACIAGYSDGSSGKVRDAGRCIVKSDTFYSLEQSLATVNKCTTDAATFTIFKNALHSMKDREESDRIDDAGERYNRILDEQRAQRLLIESGAAILNDMSVRQLLYGK